MNRFNSQMLKLSHALLIALFIFSGSMNNALASTTALSVEEQKVLIQKLLLQIQELQGHLDSIKAVSGSAVESRMRASIDIVSPHNNQSVRARQLVTDTIRWDYNAFPSSTGDLVVRERYLEPATGNWSPWVTLGRFNDYTETTSLLWAPSQLNTATQAQVLVGLLAVDEKKWITYDVVTFNLLPY